MSTDGHRHGPRRMFTPSFIDVPSTLLRRDFKRAHSLSWLTPPAISPTMSSPITDRETLLNFPLHLSHAYSYARASTNSLPLRLNSLKPHPPPLSTFDPKPPRPPLIGHLLDQDTGPNTLLPPHIPIATRQYPHKPLYLHSNNSDLLPRSEHHHTLRRTGSFSEIFCAKSSLDPTQDINRCVSEPNHDLCDIVETLSRDSGSMNVSEKLEAIASLGPAPSFIDPDQYPHIRHSLLHALAKPFNDIGNASPDIISREWPLYSYSAGKRIQLQSIFTVDLNNPWLVKAANDFACLTFGVSKSTIASLTLMDLIAPQFRSFISSRLSRLMHLVLETPIRRLKGSQQTNQSSDVVFAGEIVAILRPGDQNYAWTTMWAKRRDNLIICMFDQIPCDAFDVEISYRLPVLGSDVKINSCCQVAGRLFTTTQAEAWSSLDNICPALASDLVASSSPLADEAHDVMMINDTRYYTIKLDEERIPCAISSNSMESGSSSIELKLKVHTMPYIAGCFVVDSTQCRILSCNKAITKNLFGRGSELIGDSTLDTLIPGFNAILELGLATDPQIIMSSGLVLPEHFFRRYDASRRAQGDNATTLFLASRGLAGLHRDGSTIFVDVQLRVVLLQTYMVWISYTRSSTRSESVTSRSPCSPLMNSPLPHSPILLHSPTTTTATTANTSTTAIATTPTTTMHSPLARLSPNNPNHRTKPLLVPSQMNLFHSIHNENLDYAPSLDEINRQNSTRRAHRSTFGLPVRYFENIDERSAETGRPSEMAQQTPKKHVAQEQTTPNSTTSSSKWGNATSPHHTLRDGICYSEEEIVEMEDAQLRASIKSSTHWPAAVGLKRRSKKFSEFKLIREMGQGAYGKVVMAEHREDPLYKVIIKCIDKERILVDTWVRDRKLGTIPLEIQIMAFLNDHRHPNIMCIVDYFEDSKYYYLETPIFGTPHAIDLFDYIELRKDMLEQDCRYIFKQVASTVYHLHKNGIVHRDIKDENVIVDEKGVIKVIDFGSASYTRQGPFDVFVGTIDYASPEVLGGQKYDGKPQDVWALGILLYTILHKENPFHNVDEIMEGQLRWPVPISSGAQQLLVRILERDITKRPTITDIVEDNWLNL